MRRGGAGDWYKIPSAFFLGLGGGKRKRWMSEAVFSSLWRDYGVWYGFEMKEVVNCLWINHIFFFHAVKEPDSARRLYKTLLKWKMVYIGFPLDLLKENQCFRGLGRKSPGNKIFLQKRLEIFYWSVYRIQSGFKDSQTLMKRWKEVLSKSGIDPYYWNREPAMTSSCCPQ